ncbi:hypothetical protein DAPPUDRAFT_319046 [Daphnia pulex]|uniref:Uncharacterized protein n=1 Tax=Daphnia pulex TaxID=6669 RepID=E9GKI8_DAPPU|nr:hypothetical protein DAPPUDRAFT_319046 [Daphnia pulex]|eukprot:EFX80002.1 hypothetical protein DAPPUDRAFT_319046 [Daphnia pulex]
MPIQLDLLERMLDHQENCSNYELFCEKQFYGGNPTYTKNELKMPVEHKIISYLVYCTFIFSFKMEKDSLLFFFLNFVIQKIWDLESITIPRNFQAKSQKDKLKLSKKQETERLKLVWPSEGCELSSRPNRSTSTSKENDSMTTPKAIILNFSGNMIRKDVISKQTFDARLKRIFWKLFVKNDVIAERDNEILALKESNPDVIVKGLKDGLICLKSIIETAVSSPSRTVRVSTISQSPSSNQLTKLDEDCDTMI